MSQEQNPNFGEKVQVFRGEIPEEFDQFQIVLSGNQEPDRDKAECSFNVVAAEYAHAAAYAQELADREGYSEVAISSFSEARDRREIGYVGYEFAFPDKDNSVFVKAPEWGNPIPQVVLVLAEEQVEDLFDKDTREQRSRDRAKVNREERRGRATPLRANKDR